MTATYYRIEAILHAVPPRTNHLGEILADGVTNDVIMEGGIAPVNASAKQI